MKKRKIKSAIFTIVLILIGAALGGTFDHDISHPFIFWFVICLGIGTMYWMCFNDDI